MSWFMIDTLDHLMQKPQAMWHRHGHDTTRQDTSAR